VTELERWLMSLFGVGRIGWFEARLTGQLGVPVIRGFGVSPRMRRQAALESFRRQRVVA
jgi:hypothetical protein